MNIYEISIYLKNVLHLPKIDSPLKQKFLKMFFFICEPVLFFHVV